VETTAKKEPITIWDIPLQTNTLQNNIVQPLIMIPKMPEPPIVKKFEEPLQLPTQNTKTFNQNFSDFQRGNMPPIETNSNSGMFMRQQMPQQQQSQPNQQNSQLSPEQLNRIQELTSRRNPGAFQPDSNLGNQFPTNNNTFNRNFGGNFNNNSRESFNDNFRGDFNNQQRNQFNNNDNNSVGRMNRDDDNNMFVYDDDDDFGKPLQSSRGGNFDEKKNIPNDPMQGLCVKISNLDETTGYGEIRRFFQGLVIGNNGIKMLNDNFGRRIGVAMVQFSRNDAKCKAIYRSGYELKGRKVIVESLSDDDFADAVDSYKPMKRRNFNDDDDTEFDRERTYRERSPIVGNQRDNNARNVNNDNDGAGRYNREPSVESVEEEFTTIVLTDLPSLATEQDVMKIFSEFSLMQIIMLRTDDWKKQYQSFVKFHRAQDAKAALINKSNHYIGRRSIYIAKCSEEEFETAQRKYSPDIPAFGGQKDNQSQFGNNSPFQRPFGNKNNKNQRGRSDNNQRNGGINFAQNRNEPNSNCIMMSNLNPKTTERDILDFFSDIGIIPTKIHILRNKFKQPSGDCICEFPIVNDAVSAMAKNGGHFNQNQVTLNFITKNRVKEILSVEFMESDGEDENKKQQEQQRLKKQQVSVMLEKIWYGTQGFSTLYVIF
jgi:RNA-binding protein 12